MEVKPQIAELTVNLSRRAASTFEAECAGLRGYGPNSAKALADCVAKLCREKDLQGFYWVEPTSGLRGKIEAQRKKPRPAKGSTKGEVFDLLGGKMNGIYRMKD